MGSKSWTDDRERCQAARVPDDRSFAAKGEMARAMILLALASPLAIVWVTAESAYRQDSHCRRFLEDHQLFYVVAVPKSQQVHGPRIDHLIGLAPPEAWQRLSAGSGAKAERFYDWAAARLPAVGEFDGDGPTRQRWMPARRSIAKPDEIAYYLACASLEATVADLVHIAGCRWKIEECFQSAKNECGLDQYEVRRYIGWNRHITLAMLAHAFLAVMTAQEREKGAGHGGHARPRGSHPGRDSTSAGSWTPPPCSGPRPGNDVVPLASPPPSTRTSLPLHAAGPPIGGTARQRPPHPSPHHYAHPTQAVDQH